MHTVGRRRLVLVLGLVVLAAAALAALEQAGMLDGGGGAGPAQPAAVGAQGTRPLILVPVPQR